MKKLSLFLAILMIATCVCTQFVFATEGEPTDAPAQLTSVDDAGEPEANSEVAVNPNTRRTVAVKTETAPVIDGSIDAVWANAKIEDITEVCAEHTSHGAGVVKPNARFRTLWDDDYLYILFEVTDTSIEGEAREDDCGGGNAWARDNVVIAVNPGYEWTDTTTFNGGNFKNGGTANNGMHYIIRSLYGGCAIITGGKNGIAYGSMAAGVPGGAAVNYYLENTADGWWFRNQIIFDEDGVNEVGYIMEGKISLIALGLAEEDMAEGTFIGFTPGITDASVATNNRDYLLAWTYGASLNKQKNLLGTLELVAAGTVVDNSDKASTTEFFGSDKVDAVDIFFQDSAVESTKFTKRIIAAIEADAEVLGAIEGLGIEINNRSGQTFETDTTVVYDVLDAYLGNEAVGVAGDDVYYVAFNVKDMPSTLNSSFSVKFFVLDDEGNKNYVIEKTIGY